MFRGLPIFSVYSSNPSISSVRFNTKPVKLERQGTCLTVMATKGTSCRWHVDINSMNNRLKRTLPGNVLTTKMADKQITRQARDSVTSREIPLYRY